MRRDSTDGRLSHDGKEFMGLRAVVKLDAKLKFLDFIPSNVESSHASLLG